MINGYEIRPYADGDARQACAIWNEVVRAKDAFPQTEELAADSGARFFLSQSAVGVAEAEGELLGIYILHPNNVGRCAHIANASYAVSSKARGVGIGRALVMNSLETAKKLGFSGLQFNAVVASNFGARHLYEDVGFARIGLVPGGFKHEDGSLEDIYLYFYDLR